MSLIVAAYGNMLGLEFEDVCEMLYLAAGDGFLCMQCALRQQLGLMVF